MSSVGGSRPSEAVQAMEGAGDDSGSRPSEGVRWTVPGASRDAVVQHVGSSRHEKVVWMDCDPGHDDAMALILAGHVGRGAGGVPGRRVCLLGVSTVAGNQTVAKCTRNAISTLDAIGLEGVPVVEGLGRPLLSPAALLCPEIHGDCGLEAPGGGPVFPHSAREPASRRGVLAMFHAIKWAHEALQADGDRAGERVWVVATGALTNVAALLLMFPEARDMVRVSFMGGAVGLGNTHPAAEFNIQTDPEAARLVLDSGVPCTMVPLEVTHTALATADVIAGVRDAAHHEPGSDGAVLRERVVALLTFFKRTYLEVFGFEDPPLHDPCAVLVLTHPELFEGRPMRVDVECEGRVSRGRTVCDVLGVLKRDANCLVCEAMDVGRFWGEMLGAVAVAEEGLAAAARGGGSEASLAHSQWHGWVATLPDAFK